MSRIGRMPVAVPAGVTVTIAEGNKVTVKGPGNIRERAPRRNDHRAERWTDYSKQTKRFKEDEIFTWSDQNPG